MADKLKKSTGREVWAMLLDDSTVINTAGALTKNHLYAIKAKASSGSGLPSGLDEGDTFYEVEKTTQTTLVSGDSVIDLGDPFDKTKLIGFARSKDISRTKNTVDVTVDADEDSDVRIDPLVAVSGNINGYKINGTPATDAGRKIDAMFVKQIIEAADGTVTTIEKSDKTALIALIYIKNLRSDNSVELVIQPCVFTSNGDSTDYGSPTSKSTAFTGNALSENGVKPCVLSVTLPAASA